MLNSYQEIISSLIANQSKEDALFSLFEVMKQKIPFERLLCYNANRKTKIFSAFIEYSTAEYVADIHYPFRKLVPIERIKQFKEDAQNIQIINRKDNDQVFIFLDQLHFNPSSIMMFPIQMGADLSSNMFFICSSPKDNAFTEKHKELLSLLRPFLEEILVALYQNNPEPKVFLASKVEMPTSYEEQLRACPNLHNIVKEIETIAPHNYITLITGPNGAGKELVATSIHLLSPRRAFPFVEVNCSAIPESLLESELFGFEKGAFTGALQAKKGYFEQADKGTIFLDEIGEVSPHFQSRLLRVLETKKIQRIGSERMINLDVRVIAATNRNLFDLVKQGKFREDLYYRIKGFHIQIPPLKERRKDIKFLIEYFYSYYIEHYQIQNPPVLSYKTIRKLMEYSWPGNVRELKYSMGEAIFKAISSSRDEIEFDFLSDTAATFSSRRVRKIEAHEIQEALEKSYGKIDGRNGAAELLNINPSTLRSRMKILGLSSAKKTS